MSTCAYLIFLRCRPIDNLDVFVDRMLVGGDVDPKSCFLGQTKLLCFPNVLFDLEYMLLKKILILCNVLRTRIQRAHLEVGVDFFTTFLEL